ncbi:MAG: flagellar biosynthesis protein FlhF [Myxococcales bacterium]|nr:flagellar biosynthesis protein FlhF [Myxococcales bacterium]
MHVRRFEASTTAEAVRQIREELGDDALILSVRKIRRDHGMFGLFSKAAVEVTASVDRQVRRGEPAYNSSSVIDAQAEDGSNIKLPGSDSLLTRAALAPLESELKLLRAELRTLHAGHAEDDGAVRDELEALRRMLAENGGWGASGARSGVPGFAGALGRSGLSMRHLERIAATAKELATEGQTSLELAYREALAARIEERIVIPRSDRPERVELFVGAPGVGKTTTLAKIAAQEDERDDRVSLMTTDTFRIGAEEQLRTYADLLQVSFATAVSPRAVGDCVKQWGNRRILIDSAGRGRSDRAAMGELLEIRRTLGSQAMVHLVLSAETKEADLREQVRRYAPLHPDSIIVTRMDESDHWADVANVLLDETTPPLMWLGTGQRVPEDLMLPDSRDLAEQLLEEAA